MLSTVIVGLSPTPDGQQRSPGNGSAGRQLTFGKTGAAEPSVDSRICRRPREYLAQYDVVVLSGVLKFSPVR
jgi:hypothetical protein